MLVLKKKRHGVTIIDCWFAREPIRSKGLIRYKECCFEPVCADCVSCRTLWSDLTLTEEEIIACFSKNCRYEVRRAAKEGVCADIVMGRDLLRGELIEDFLDFFVDFWRSKGIEYGDREKCKDEILWYAENNAFAISIAKIQGKPIVYHTYIVDDEIVRLYHSASQFRTDEEISQQLIGYANRFLHKEDMLFFKTTGKRIYDWGGAGQREEVASITRFKESFGGTPMEFYNGTQRIGIVARLYGCIVRIVGNMHRKRVE